MPESDRCPVCHKAPCSCIRNDAARGVIVPAPTFQPYSIPVNAGHASWHPPKMVRVPVGLARLLCEEAIALEDDVWTCPACGGTGKLRAEIEHVYGCELERLYTHLGRLREKGEESRDKVKRKRHLERLDGKLRWCDECRIPVRVKDPDELPLCVDCLAARRKAERKLTGGT